MTLGYTTGDPLADTAAPSGPIEERWDERRFAASWSTRPTGASHRVIVVGTGLAGGSAGATLAEQGYHVVQFCFQDSPAARPLDRRAGRDQRREELPQRRRLGLSALLRHGQGRRLPVPRIQRLPAGPGRVKIIDQCVAQGVPFAREYGGLLDNRVLRRRAGLAHLLRPRPDRPAAAARRVPGARPADRRRQRGMFPRTEMLDLVVVDGRARGIVTRDLVTGEVASTPATPWCSATGGYGNVFYLSTNAKGSNATAIWRAHKRGATSPTRASRRSTPPASRCQRRVPVQAHPDERVAAQRRPHLGAAQKGDQRAARPDPRGRARLLPGADLPEFGNLVAPRHRLPRREEPCATKAAASARAGSASTSTSATRSRGWARRRRGEVRQPLRDVRADHREEPVRGADAHLPRDPLHDGRPVGRLRPAEHRPGPVRDRRGQLLRPRREPARRLGADAGARRRLLRAALRSPTTWPATRSSRSTRTTSGAPDRGRGGRTDTGCSRSRAPGPSTRSTASSARSSGSSAAWRAPRPACARRWTGSRSCARSSGGTWSCPGTGERLNQ